ncbi:MAG: DUF2784 domain-containing protein [Burkholderiales bacterium]|nr:DUF2784 domain-containing protein [Burkholderiales bacterium]
MAYRLAADAVLLVHLLFVAFVVAGGVLAFWRAWIARVHLPALAWGMFVEFSGWICPLTPWENQLRRWGGEAGYAGGFVEHYVVPVLYPEGLTRGTQVLLGAVLVGVNVVVYGVLWFRWMRRRAHRIEHSVSNRNSVH